MKKLIGVIILTLLIAGSIFAQDVFFCTTEGQSLLFANLNKKGKVDSYTRQIIGEVAGSGGNFTITYTTLALDNKKIPQGIPFPLTVKFVDGVMEMDLKSLAAPGSEAIAEVTGDPIRIPASLKVGDKLPDQKYNLRVLWINTPVTVTEQEVLAIEDVTVPAGTFTATKLTQTATAGEGKKPMVTKTITWYAPGLGAIKTENYDAKGKIINSVVLHEIE